MKLGNRIRAGSRGTAEDPRGLSLLDLMATLTLVAIIGTIAAPAVNRYVEAARLRGAGWSLASDLQRVRQRSVSENRSLRLILSETELDPETGSPRAYEVVPAGGGSPVERREFPESVQCASAPGSYVEFNSRGLAAGAARFDLYGNTGGTVSVRVRSTGQVDFSG